MLKVVNVNQAFDSFNEHWSPRIVGKLNGQHLKVVKLKESLSGTNTRTKMNCFMYLKGSYFCF